MSVTAWILGDQLMHQHPALLAAEQEVGRANVSVLLVESETRKTRLPYQRKKLVLLFSALRHYAEALRGAGYHVDYVRASTAQQGIRDHVRRWQPSRLYTMEAAEYRGRMFQRAELAPMLGMPVTLLPNTQFLTGRYNPVADATKKVILEHFYRNMRRHWQLLLDEQGAPLGGAWNFDKANRRPLPKQGLTSPPLLGFEPDEITRSVMAEVANLPSGIGRVHGFSLPVTHAQAKEAFDNFVRHRLADFGPYEDAMSQRNPTLFHSVLSPYLNLGLLDPLEMVRRAERAYLDGAAPINSVEGFIRQIVGWREYIYWQYWQQMPELLTANSWRHTRPMPQLFWDGETEMSCLQHVVERVVDTGYNHHIERLMLICNFCMLSGVDPAAVNSWFLTHYVDAYEWVVAPNVIGMGLNADGGQTATKPYISSANYIDKMSDYCTGCRYDPRRRTGDHACPFNFLYWNFLIQNEETLRANPRLGPAVLGLRNLDNEQRKAVQRQAQHFLKELTYYRGD